MKTEETSSTTTPATTPATPATSYPTQWASTLQQQTTPSQYYSYPSHYPQSPYAPHYQSYAPPVSAAATTSATAQPKSGASYQTTTTGNTTSAGASNAMDISTLNDALGSAGVDLRAEEESLQHPASHSGYPRSYEDRTRKQPLNGPAFDTRFLSATMRTIGTNHKVTRIPDDTVAYLALCLRARLQDLITAMVKAAKYRSDAEFERPAGLYQAIDAGEPTPMWSLLVRNDVAKQLAALEKVEREEELRIRKERKDRADMQAAHAAALAAQMAGGASNMSGASELGGGEDADSSMPKKKRKKEGPGVTARNMSEDVRKKMSNAVATQAAGLGGKYAWMTSANATGAGAAKPKPAGTATTAGSASTSAASATGSSWARPYVPSTKKLGATGAMTTSVSGTVGMTGSGSMESEDAPATLTRITMRDAMFVIDHDRGHGGGRGSARGWT